MIMQGTSGKERLELVFALGLCSSLVFRVPHSSANAHG